MAWLGTYAYRREITVDNTNVDSDLTHFPVPIVLGTSVGQSSQDVSDIFDEVGASYLKIAVTKADGTTQIYAEVEQWDLGNEKAVVWVSKSDLTIASAATTTLYIYYDSTQADNTTYVGVSGSTPGQSVWDSNFAAVYHMAQDPSGGAGCILDSTVNANHGTPQGSMTSGDLVDGLIGKAIEFDGSDDCINIGTALTSANIDFTFTALVNITGTGEEFIITFGDTTYTVPRSMLLRDATNGFQLFSGNLTNNISGLLTSPKSTSTYYVVCGTRNDQTGKIYVDGALEDTVVGSGVPSGIEDDGYIGANEQQDGFLAGRIDYLRISSVERSADWAKATSASLIDNLITFGVIETVTIEPPEAIIQSAIDSDLQIGIDVPEATSQIVAADPTIFISQVVTTPEINIPVIADTSSIAVFRTVAATSLIYLACSIDDPFETCEDCVVTDPFATTGIIDPYSGCGTNLVDCSGCPWEPFGEGYFYVKFPLSTYVTRTWSPSLDLGNGITGILIVPTVDNGYYYRVFANVYPAVLGATEPTWPTLFGETVLDGDVTWECYGYRTTTSSYMTANTTPAIIQCKLFGSYILTLSSSYVLECWSGGIPNVDGKVSATENITLVWRQHVRTFPDLVYDEYLGLITDPNENYIFLDTEDGFNGDGINWLDTEGNFVKYTRLRTSAQIGTRLQNGPNFCSSHGATTTSIYTLEFSDIHLHKVTYSYVSPGVYEPTADTIIDYPGLLISVSANNFLYSLTEATVTLAGDNRHSLVTLNSDGTVTSLDRVSDAVWTNSLHGGYNMTLVGSSVTKVFSDYLLVGPVTAKKWQFLLCEPDTINPITY
jgi:hypothetical protein